MLPVVKPGTITAPASASEPSSAQKASTPGSPPSAPVTVFDKLSTDFASKACEQHLATTRAIVRAPRRAPLPFAQPDIDDHDIDAVTEVLRSGWLTTGSRVAAFEGLFAERIGVRNAIALNSATAALHLALDAAGLERGDEVVVPTMTFTACAEVVRYFDATPVLVDIEPGSLCISVDALAAAITERTRAVIPVHMGGGPARMDEIMAIAASSGVAVVEDAAHAFPATYRGRAIGSIGHMAAFSFYVTKTITTGEGGMLVTDDDSYAERVRAMSLHGMSRDAWNRYAGAGTWKYDVVAPGFKYNMTDLAAALGISQLKKSDRMAERRKEIARRYSAELELYPELQVPEADPRDSHAWHLYVLRLRTDVCGVGRDQFIEELSLRGIKASVHFIPIHRFTYYRGKYGYVDEQFPVASAEAERILSLPIYPSMSDHDIDDVIWAVTDTIETHRR